MKNLSLLFVGMVMLAAGPAAMAQDPLNNAPEFLAKQDPETCMAKKIINYFKKEQMIENSQGIPSNFNGKFKIDESVGGKLDGQMIQSTRNGYWVRIRMLDSGLNGEVLEMSFTGLTCMPTKAVTSAGGQYIPIRLEGNKCVEPRPPYVYNNGKATPTPTATPMPQTAAQKFCALLKGDKI